jgi:hypothetical protein
MGLTPPDTPDEGLTPINLHNVPLPMDIDSEQPAGQEPASSGWAQQSYSPLRSQPGAAPESLF